MQISREWATPLTIGTFLIMATTGILMFFHLDRGLNKEAHEWLGWAMVAGVGTHVVANLSSFKRYLGKAWDDRVGCAVVIEALRRLRAAGHPNQLFVAATVQEESACAARAPRAT